MISTDLIAIDPDILAGTPGFKGTRVAVKTLFDYLENNDTLDGFVECLPSATPEMARSVLERFRMELLHPLTLGESTTTVMP